MNESDETIIETSEEPFIISNELAKKLLDYFQYRAGYISYEFDWEIRTELIPLLRKYIDG